MPKILYKKQKPKVVVTTIISDRTYKIKRDVPSTFREPTAKKIIAKIIRTIPSMIPMFFFIPSSSPPIQKLFL